MSQFNISENYLKDLALNNPDELLRLCKEEELPSHTLTFALEDLKEVNSKEAFKVLEEMLFHPSSIVREGAVYGLAGQNKNLVIPLLKDALNQEMTPGVREAIYDVLEDL